MNWVRVRLTGVEEDEELQTGHLSSVHLQQLQSPGKLLSSLHHTGQRRPRVRHRGQIHLQHNTFITLQIFHKGQWGVSRQHHSCFNKVWSIKRPNNNMWSLKAVLNNMHTDYLTKSHPPSFLTIILVMWQMQKHMHLLFEMFNIDAPYWNVLLFHNDMKLLLLMIAWKNSPPVL